METDKNMITNAAFPAEYGIESFAFRVNMLSVYVASKIRKGAFGVFLKSQARIRLRDS